MYAIFRAQGKQFRADPEATLRIPTLNAEPGDKVTFDEVLLAEKDGDIRVGTPSLDGAAVAAEIVGHGRGEKIVVYKMKRRKGYRKKQGHRQGYTEIKIVEISFPKGKKQPIKKAAPVVEEAVADEPVVEEVVEASAEATVADVAEETVVEAAEETATEAAAQVGDAPVEDASDGDYDITPAALELATANGIDLATIEGSGKEGRILKSDIDKAIKEKDA
ncbi:MAG: 50S ribosomal protein L21 [Gemmatimonadota bacterium]|nr:50S ribosomal protein L21 [Gemmatimonadota bacterium]